MNPCSSIAFSVFSLCLGLAFLPECFAQSIGRTKKSLEKATGGVAAVPVPRTGVVATSPQTVTQAQTTAAAEDLAKKRNQKSQIGVDERVNEFLRQRIEGGSADAAFDLAKRLDEGKGIEADPKEARRLYGLAAERGNEDAKLWLEAHPKPVKAESSEPKNAAEAGLAKEIVPGPIKSTEK